MVWRTETSEEDDNAENSDEDAEPGIAVYDYAAPDLAEAVGGERRLARGRRTMRRSANQSMRMNVTLIGIEELLSSNADGPTNGECKMGMGGDGRGTHHLDSYGG